jgi:hypothetical protein
VRRPGRLYDGAPPSQEQTVQADPSGIANDRAVVSRIEDDTAVLAVGPGRTPMHVPVDELPEGCVPGSWLVLDMQLSPPMVLWIDQAMTAERSRDA